MNDGASGEFQQVPRLAAFERGIDRQEKQDCLTE
jgi:hypothetical protein